MSRQQSNSTLLQFLAQGDTRLHLFDMGRRVVKIPRKRFLQLEKNQMAYPAPLQRQAWFALLFQEPDRLREPIVWFLRFPLDEQAKLNLAARDDLMHRLVEWIGSDPADSLNSSGHRDAVLEQNPYGFKPRNDRLAIFHARISRLLKQPASRHYDHARSYFNGEFGWDQWSFVGYQGIADIAARLDQDDNEQCLIVALPELPASPLEAICHCLENERVSRSLANALLGVARAELRQVTPAGATLAATIRGISNSRSVSTRQQLISEVLAAPVSQDPAVLSAISGRSWEDLQQQALAAAFLERLAGNREGQPFFDLCLADLLFIPGMRAPLLKALRNPNRSSALSRAVGGFFQSLKGVGDG
ncbi:MAG: DUF3549 family protein [Gammaproteobacteria bacterium]|nr:DUF3549 family protein [Gammaproteobacteria bacterium]MCP5416902.1 DUF3549 family protein [Chromatiaceae bacterium]